MLGGVSDMHAFSPIAVVAVAAGLACAAEAQTTNWQPKAPPRAYSARVQMHNVPLEAAFDEREELHAFEIPAGLSGNTSYRLREAALNQQPTPLRQATVRKTRKDETRSEGPLPKEKSGIRAMLASEDEELDRQEKRSPWEGLDGREMSRRMAAREWQLSHPGETPPRDRGADGQEPDTDNEESQSSLLAWRKDASTDRSEMRTAVRDHVPQFADSPADRFGQIAREYMGSAMAQPGDRAAQGVGTFEDIARRFEELQKSSQQSASRAAALDLPSQQQQPSVLRASEAGQGAGGWGEASLGGLRTGSFAPAGEASPFLPSPGASLFSGSGSAFGGGQPSAGGGVFQRTMEYAPVQPAGGAAAEFKKTSALPW